MVTAVPELQIILLSFPQACKGLKVHTSIAHLLSYKMSFGEYLKTSLPDIFSDNFLYRDIIDM